MMFNNTTNNPKAIGITAIMGNQKLSKVIQDAYKAPLGSSKREKAAAILKSVMMNNRPMDGMGGAPDSPFGVQNPYTQNNGISIDPRSVNRTPRVSPTPTIPTPPLIQQPIPPVIDTTPKVMYKPAPALKQPTSNEGDTRVNPTTGKTETLTPTGSWLPQDTAQSGDVVDTWYNENLSPEEQTNLAPLYEVYQKDRPNATRMALMGDTEKMKEMFPNLPEDQLPIGASLSGQLQELESNLNKEYGLDQKLGELRNMRDQGLTIEKDLESYINERDTYSKSLDNMRYKFMQNPGMDMSNPTNRKISENYMGYLTVLQGRQDKNYSNYLKDGVQYYKDQYQMNLNSYNDLKAKFDTELSTAKEARKEDFKSVSNWIEEMSKYLDDMDDNQLKALETQQKLIKLAKETALLAIGFDEKIDSVITKAKSDLNSGTPWSTVWKYVKSLYPNADNKLIDQRLGGGEFNDQAEAEANGKTVTENLAEVTTNNAYKDPSGRILWGWAIPDYFSILKKSTKVSGSSGSAYDSYPEPTVE